MCPIKHGGHVFMGRTKSSAKGWGEAGAWGTKQDKDRSAPTIMTRSKGDMSSNQVDRRVAQRPSPVDTTRGQIPPEPLR